MSPENDRGARRHKAETPDSRTPGQRDRDRVLYCSAFRRLAGVTQVVGPVEGHIFHNRLTHTLEVAQIARRLAERFVQEQPNQAKAFGGIDPDVVEAAALVHDLGHPPFGHAAEEQLNELIGTADSDGFEGNPQSFRIVVRLAAHRTTYKGLNLTRATLNAILKYPYFRKGTDPAKLEKFGVYKSDAADFDWARAGQSGEQKCPEAEIMDHADAIAYSVHDLDDFYRAGLIPMDRLTNPGSEEFDLFLKDWKTDPARRGVTQEEIDAHRITIQNWLVASYVQIPLRHTWRQSAELKTITAAQIADFVNSVRLSDDKGNDRALVVPSEKRVLLRFCQRLVWRYVIKNPRLATQQAGQRQIIRNLFEFYHGAVKNKDVNLVPARFAEDVRSPPKGVTSARLASDIVACLTDAQALAMHRRITGTAVGSVTTLL